MSIDSINRYCEHDREKIDYLGCIRKIGDILKQAGGMNELFYEFAEPHLNFLSENLHIDQISAALFAALVNIFDGHDIGINRFSRYLNISCIEIIGVLNELEKLEEKELVQINRGDDHTLFSHDDMFSFKLPLGTIEALGNGICHKLLHKKCNSTEDFLLEIERLCEERVQKRVSYKNTLSKMKKLLDDNTHLDFVEKLKEIQLQDDDMLVLLRFFHYTVNVDEPDMPIRYLEALYEHSSQFTGLKRLLRNGNYTLLKRCFIENSCDDGFSDSDYFRLTDAVRENFLGDLNDLLTDFPVKGLKRSDSIEKKDLYYPGKTQQAVLELTSLLLPDNFPAIQKRLCEQGLRTGFACLFSGSPGTGKTETAYQIARMCERDIMQIDIANTKSKWFGESEKKIKSLFDKYRATVKKQAVTPILLFNEADAVFSKRQFLTENRNGPVQTENTIQNIILSEIENLSGILIATTNLSTNLDAAFERRFLYKIEFEKPDGITRKAIWRSMISGLSEADARYLALHYDFSGGQIENIARKVSVHKVLSGNSPSLEEMNRFCEEETIYKEGSRQIGFIAS